MNPFADQVAFVTGGASGIGRASALAFAKRGARVVIADRAVDGGRETVSLLEELGAPALFVAADVSAAREIEAAVARTVEEFGRIDIAHNNAGILGSGAEVDIISEKHWDEIIATNLKGVWLSMKYEIRQMRRQGAGSIVNTASVAGVMGAPGFAAYSASKHGVVGLTKSAALELAKLNIRVNAVCPGHVRTPLLNEFIANDRDLKRALLAQQPMGRLGSPSEIAEAVLWLSSDAASFVTGCIHTVDGGISAH